MTATPQPPWTPPPPPPPAPASGMSAGRIVALVLGVLLLVPGLALLAGGGAVLWADLRNRTDGYVFSDTDTFSTDGYALSSERIDLATGADWLPLSAALGTARAKVTSADPAADVFVGIAPLADGTAYLDGVARSVIGDLGTGPVGEVAVPGGPPSGPPAQQDFWAAQASGPGTQRLDWEPVEGEWLFVVMNADGSAGVYVDARVGATVPALGGLAWGLLGAGAFLTLIGIVLLVVAIRRPARRVPPYGAPTPAPTGPPPYWTPPVPSDRTTAADARPDPTRSGRPPTPPG
jgi:hypothetical protein